MTDPVDPRQNQLLASLPSEDWLRWDPFDAKDQGDLDLSTYQERPCRAIAARTLKAGVAVRYLGIEVDDALEISEQTEI